MEHTKTLAQILESKIRMRYHNIKRFSEESGIPYMTISGVLKRGVENSNFGTILKICNALNITISDLFDAQIFDTLHSKINSMSSDEYTDEDLIDDLIDCKKINISKRRYTDEELNKIAKSYRIFLSDAFDPISPEDYFTAKRDDKKDGD